MIWVFIKAIFFFSIAIALAVAFNFIKDTDGTLTIDFLNREYQLSFISFFALILSLLFFALMINIALKFLWSLIGFLRGDDTALKRFFEKRSERKGQSILISAYTASFEGDHERALSEIKRSKKYLKSKSLPNILSLSSYDAKGNVAKQEEIFQELIKDKTTRSMGLFGLIKMKLTEGNTSLALKLTERLIKLKPRNLSFNKTFFNLQLTEGDWDGALTSYKNINKIKRIDKETFNKGESILLDIDPQGAAQVRARMPECVSIFILPPSIEIVEKRLRNRNTDSEEVISARMLQIREQLQHCQGFDYLLINDDLQSAQDQFQAILITTLLQRTHRNQWIERFTS